MNTNIIFLPYVAARDLVLQYPKKFNVVSAETELVINPALCNAHLHLNINDLDERWFKFAEENPQYRLCGMLDLHKLYEFDNKYPVDIVHCAAGISRSPALVYFLYRKRGLTGAQAWGKVCTELTLPNKLITKLSDIWWG
jgi:predicted protein tyrosine phosphatase